MKVIVTDKTASFKIFFIQTQTINPIQIPSTGPPIDNLTKLVTTPTTVADYPLTKPMKSIKKTIAVPSFSKDSPSTKRLNWTLAPNYFKSATTATGSVADSTHPKVQA